MDKDFLHENFRYDPDTGVLYRIKTCSGGKLGPVGTRHRTGYLVITIKQKQVPVHRVICAMMGLEVPPGHEVDHVNRVRCDNRWENLRVVSHAENMFNTTGKRETGLPKNVNLDKRVRYKKYRVTVKANSVDHYIGHFYTESEAEQAAIAARLRLHGEYANHG